MQGDPRGGTVAVNDGGQDVLTGVCSGEGESEDSTSKLRARLAPTALAPAGSRGEGGFRDPQGRPQEVRGRGRGRPGRATTPVFVDGVERGTIVADSLGRGQIEFGDDNGGPPLDFDPARKGDRRRERRGRALQRDPRRHDPRRQPVHRSPRRRPRSWRRRRRGRAAAHTKLRIREDCRRDFSVEIEDVPVGGYDLFVGGVLRGTIQVADVGGGDLKGELEFTSEQGEPELFLDFEPVGATVEVKQADVLFFSLTQGRPGTGGGGGGGGSCTACRSRSTCRCSRRIGRLGRRALPRPRRLPHGLPRRDRGRRRRRLRPAGRRRHARHPPRSPPDRASSSSATRSSPGRPCSTSIPAVRRRGVRRRAR